MRKSKEMNFNMIIGKKHNFTPEQEAAILHRGNALLVSAAAGSGKTRVLVERLLNRIEHGDNIDEFLVITYTRAAASELRERIYDEIIGRMADDSGDINLSSRHMWRQSMLCKNAQIDTIHSFCTEILRENAHLIGLQPDFRVADETENVIIKANVLDDVLDKAYESGNPSDGFRNLVDLISPGRNDKQLVDTIIGTHARLQSCPDLGGWIKKQSELLSLDSIHDVTDTIWGEYLIKRAEKMAVYWYEEMSALLDEMKSHPDFLAAYGNSIRQTLVSIKGFIAALSDSWDAANEYNAVDFPRAGRVSGYDELKEVRLRCKKAMEKCAGVFKYKSGELLDDMRAIAPQLTELFKLILDFERAFANEKLRRGVVDFSDLEHLCLSLLVIKETGERTSLAETISKRYKEILVDEYQDVNAVQEMIFNAVSAGGRNIFMVGDVKQSIYRFRLADPSIFLSKYRSFKEADIEAVIKSDDVTDNNMLCDTNSCGEKIHLSKNFRSRAGVLDAVNLVFSKVMSVDFGDMDYTSTEYLVAGKQDDEDIRQKLSEEPVIAVEPWSGIETESAAEIDIIDMSAFDSDDEEDSITKIRAEAQFIAKKIKELTNGDHLITDKQKNKRAIENTDIVILLRSIRDRAWQYASALKEYGIPSDLPGGEGYFETIEVSAALSILMVIDNPMQDIPLAAALRGPVYGFSADELAEIRACSPHTDFYTALIIASETNKKCSEFLCEIESLRILTPDMPADRFIWHMYNKTGLPARVGAMRHGERRRENLILLAENARNLEQSGYKGLFGFLTFIHGQREKGLDPIREITASGKNAVRIMSIHKSKGLEFPVVFLADTIKKPNDADAREPLILHSDFGAGCKRVDLKRRIKFDTLSRMAIANKITLENKSEELRVLYVAMTRAEEKLIITAALNDAEKEINKLNGLAQRGIAPQMLEEVRNVAGWVLLPALADKTGCFKVTVHEPVDEKSNDLLNQCEAQRSGFALKRKSNEVERMPELARAEHNAVCFDEIKERFEFEYPYKNAPDLPSKLTVTELKGKWLNQESDPDALPSDAIQQTRIFERPGFVKKKTGMTGAERGTALHLVMQYIDLKCCGSLDEIDLEVKRLTLKGFLTTEQAAAIDVRKIFSFFESGIGKRLLQSDNVIREFKFSLLSEVRQIYPDLVSGSESLDKILIQGVVDCFFEENDELTVVDFKTDYVTAKTLNDKVKLYTPQLAVYADALERITGKQVTKRLIYFFALDTACEV